jgi:hypothetical protein
LIFFLIRILSCPLDPSRLVGEKFVAADWMTRWLTYARLPISIFSHFFPLFMPLPFPTSFFPFPFFLSSFSYSLTSFSFFRNAVTVGQYVAI